MEAVGPTLGAGVGGIVAAQNLAPASEVVPLGQLLGFEAPLRQKLPAGQTRQEDAEAPERGW